MRQVDLSFGCVLLVISSTLAFADWSDPSPIDSIEPTSALLPANVCPSGPISPEKMSLSTILALEEQRRTAVFEKQQQIERLKNEIADLQGNDIPALNHDSVRLNVQIIELTLEGLGVFRSRLNGPALYQSRSNDRNRIPETEFGFSNFPPSLERSEILLGLPLLKFDSRSSDAQPYVDPYHEIAPDFFPEDRVSANDAGVGHSLQLKEFIQMLVHCGWAKIVAELTATVQQGQSVQFEGGKDPLGVILSVAPRLCLDGRYELSLSCETPKPKSYRTLHQSFPQRIERSIESRQGQTAFVTRIPLISTSETPQDLKGTLMLVRPEIGHPTFEQDPQAKVPLNRYRTGFRTYGGTRY